MSLTETIRRVLQRAGAPLTVDQLMEQLPDTCDRASVHALCSQRKKAGEFSSSVEGGRVAYAWRERVASVPDPEPDPEPDPVSESDTGIWCGLPEVNDSRAAPVTVEVLPQRPMKEPTLQVERSISEDKAIADAIASRPVIASKPGTDLIEHISDSATSCADALFEAIQASASKSLMSKLAIAHKALHEAHVELLAGNHG